MIDIMEVLAFGDSIKIEEKKGDESFFLESTIVDIDVKKNIFKIYNPIYKKRLYMLSKEKKYTFRYIDKRSGIYSFEGTVIKREKEKGLYILTVKFKGNTKKNQRREFFRIKVMKKVTVKEPLEKNFKNSKKMLEFKKRIKFKSEEFVLKDISGGGIGFYSNHKYEKNTIIIVELVLLDKKIEVLGEIVRVIPDVNSDYNFIIGVKFLNLDSKTRSDVVSFIFSRQRELRKKGLI